MPYGNPKHYISEETREAVIHDIMVLGKPKMETYKKYGISQQSGSKIINF